MREKVSKVETETHILRGESDTPTINPNFDSYFLFFYFFRVPKSVEDKLVRLQCRFL